MNRALLELQEIDNQIAAFTRERSRLDDGAAARAARDELAAKLKQTGAQQGKSVAALAGAELELQTAETKIALQQKRLMSASSAHEISALERDIAALNRARGDLDENILVLMDEGENLSAQLADLKTKLAKAEAQVEKIEADFQSDSARLERSLKAAREKWIPAQSALSAAENEKYAAFTLRFGGVAVASALKGNCSACGAAILQFTLREAKNQQFPTCEGCGRLIFVA